MPRQDATLSLSLLCDLFSLFCVPFGPFKSNSECEARARAAE